MIAKRRLLGLLATMFGGLTGTVWIGLWKIVPIMDPVDLLIENRDEVDHTVRVMIHDGPTTDAPVVYDEQVEVKASMSGTPLPGRTRREDLVDRVGKYRVIAELDDGTHDDYLLQPLDTPIWGTKMPLLVVDIEGELGHFRVLGAGGKP